jgi:hypothetical protein
MALNVTTDMFDAAANGDYTLGPSNPAAPLVKSPTLPGNSILLMFVAFGAIGLLALMPDKGSAK